MMDAVVWILLITLSHSLTTSLEAQPASQSTRAMQHRTTSRRDRNTQTRTPGTRLPKTESFTNEFFSKPAARSSSVALHAVSNLSTVANVQADPFTPTTGPKASLSLSPVHKVTVRFLSPDSQPQIAEQERSDCVDKVKVANATHLNLTFLAANRTLLFTPSLYVHIHGSPKLNASTGILVLRGPNSFLEINSSCAPPCLTDLLQCPHGLTIQLDVALPSLPLPAGSPVHLLRGQGLSFNESGIILAYEKEAFKGQVRLERYLWQLDAPSVLASKKTYRVQLSWSPGGDGLDLMLDGRLVQRAAQQELSTLYANAPTALRIGPAGSGKSTSNNQTMEISNVNVWTGSRRNLQTQGMWTADTTPPAHPTDVAVSPATSTFRWIFSSASGSVMMSGGLRAVLKGNPKLLPLGVELSQSGQYVQVANLRRNLSCLVVTEACQTGVTVEVEFMPRAVSEGAVIFTSGADNDQKQGLALTYRFGEFHAVVNIRRNAVYVSFSGDRLPLDQVTQLQIGFQPPAELRVYVRGELVGAAKTGTATGVERSSSGGNTLYLGRSSGLEASAPPAGCTIASVTVWLAGPDELENAGLLKTTATTVSTPPETVPLLGLTTAQVSAVTAMSPVAPSLSGASTPPVASVSSTARTSSVTPASSPASTVPATSASTTTQHSPPTAAVCSLDCGPNKRCVAGVCLCDTRGQGSFCDATQNSTPAHHTTVQLCDLRHNACDHAILQEPRLDSSQNVTCYVLYVNRSQVSDAAQLNWEGAEQTMARYAGDGRFLCPLRDHLSAWVWTEAASFITTSNTTSSSKNVVLHYVYDSLCHTCYVHADSLNITCTRRDSCQVKGQCFSRGQQHPSNVCYVCSPDLNPSNWTLMTDENCLHSGAQNADSGDIKVTIVALGSLAGVLVLLAVVAGVVYFVARKKTSRKLGTIQAALSNLRTRSFAAAFHNHSFLRSGEFPRPDGSVARDEDLDNELPDQAMMY